MLIERKIIINKIASTLKPLNFAYALWEGGAAAFNQVDEWSDINLYVIAKDDYVEEIFNAVDSSLESLSTIDYKYDLPQPTWHGHAQAYYHLTNSSKYLIINFLVIKHSNPNKFVESEVHGDVVVYFDKIFLIPHNLDIKGFFKKIQMRLKDIESRVQLIEVFVSKELNRKNYIEAYEYYYRSLLDLLVEILRIRYSPYHYNFKATYIAYDLPDDVVGRLKKLYFVKDGEQLEANYNEAFNWLKSELSTLDINIIKDRYFEKKNNPMNE